MSTDYTELQLDALQELASIGSGTAATALGQLLGRTIELDVPVALALPLADAVDAIGPPDAPVASAVMSVTGDIDAVVLLLFSPEEAVTLCGLLEVEPATELGDSALGEIANILGTSALNALATLTGLALEPRPPYVVHDMLGAIVASALTETAGELEVALMLDAELDVAGAPCSLTFLFLPTADGIAELLARLGLER